MWSQGSAKCDSRVILHLVRLAYILFAPHERYEQRANFDTDRLPISAGIPRMIGSVRL